MRELELTYRRLLLAYPRYYRRERGLEILTTLMDAAASGTHRPSTRDKLDLVFSGLRFRFSPPHGWHHSIVAALVSVFIGASLAAFAAACLWMSSPTVPRPEQRADLLGEQPVHETSNHPVSIWFHDYRDKNSPARLEGWPHGQPAFVFIEQLYRPANVDATIPELHRRMPADGWAVGELMKREHGYVFWASRDKVVVRVQGLRLDGASPSVSVQTHLAAPAAVTPAAIVSFVLGTIGAWLVACGLLRRGRARAHFMSPVRRQSVFIAGMVTLVAQGLLLALMLGEMLLLTLSWGWAHSHWLSMFSTLGSAQLLTFAAIVGPATVAVITFTAPDRMAEIRREPISQ